MLIDVRITAAIMHVPGVGRDDSLASIVSALEPMKAEIVADPERRGVWPTARRAWVTGLDAGGTHHLVIQDDAAPCSRFRELLSSAVAQKPDAILSLFTMRRLPVEEARGRGLSWAWGPDAAYGLALLMPVGMIGAMLAWEREHIREDYPHDDNRVALFARASGLGVWLTCPQLVNHGALPSLLGHRWSSHGAPWLSGGDDVDWTAGADAPVHIPANVRWRAALRDPERPPW